MRESARFVIILVTLGAALGTARAQVQSNDNQIHGTFRFSNVNPEARAILAQFPVDAGRAIARHPTLGSAWTDLVPDAGGGATFELSVQTLPEGASHEISLDGVSIAPNYDYDLWKPESVMSAPVFPEPAPDVDLLVEECAALVRVKAFDQAGNQVPWPYTTVTSTSGSFVARSSISAHPMEDYLVLPVRTTPWSAVFEIAGCQGVTQAVGPVGCDEIIDVSVTLIPWTGSADTCSVVGLFDVVDEVELVDSYYGPRTKVQFNDGAHVFRTAPAQGAFEVRNLRSGRLRATAYASVRGYDRYQELEFTGDWFDCPTGSSTDIGSMFVVDPGSIAGQIFIAGPAESADCLSALRYVQRASSDQDGVYWTFTVARTSKLMMEGHGDAIWFGRTQGLFEGEFAERSAAFEGSYDLLAPETSAANGTFKVFALELRLRRNDGRGPWLEEIATVRPNIPSPVAVPAGTTVIQDWRYCASEVEFAFESSAGEFKKPRITAVGSFTGSNFEGNPADYVLYASSSSDPSVPPATTGTARALLIEGTYEIRPSIDIINPGGGVTRTELPPFPLTVGCRERLAVQELLQVHVTVPPDACSGSTARVAGAVSGGSDVASLEWRVNGGPGTVACAPCAIDPPFDVIVPLTPGDNEIVVEATDAGGHRASATVTTRHAPEPASAGTAPLMAMRTPAGGVRLTWGGGPVDLYAVHRGTIGSLWATRSYDHARVSACDLAAPELVDDAPGPDAYYLVTAGCGLQHGSYGRDSRGRERPRSANDCP